MLMSPAAYSGKGILVPDVGWKSKDGSDADGLDFLDSVPLSFTNRGAHNTPA